MYSTPHQLISQTGQYQLRYFEPQQIYREPVLICYSLIQSGAILDLTPEHSFIKKLLDQGIPVYMLDWQCKNNTPHSLSEKIFEDYKSCVDHICNMHQLAQIHLLGVCQGGNLSLIFSNLFTSQVKSLTLINTPIDFKTTEDNISQIIQRLDLDNYAKKLPVLPGKFVSQFFILLKPFQFFTKTITSSPTQFKKLFLNWIASPPDISAKSLIEFVRSAYIKNEYLTGMVTLGEQSISLQKFKQKILSIHSKQDHIVPIHASQAIQKITSENQLQELILPGGHLGILLSAHTQQTICTEINSFIQ